MNNSYDHMAFMRPSSAPMVKYWWYRKQSQVINLLIRHNKQLSDKEIKKESSPLFVDLGCGSGDELLLYQKWFENNNYHKWNFIGIGLNSGVEYFPDKMNNIKNNVKYLVGDITKKLPFEDNEVDILYCSEVIEHIPDPEAFLVEIKRVLNPQGYLIITTPNEPNLFQRSYWSRKHREKIKKIQEVKLSKPQFQFQIEGETVNVWGHISVRTIKEWEETFHNLGFKTIDYARGSAIYGANKLFDNQWILAAFFLLEALLDLFPRQMTRNISSQLIGMYSIKEN